MTESLFAAIRIVAMAIHADGVLKQSEMQWFRHMLGRYQLTSEQMQIINSHLDGLDQLEEAIRLVRDHRDRSRLLEWVRFVSRIDGDVHYKEKAFLARIERLCTTETHKDPYKELAEAVLEEQRESDFWKDLKEMGEFYKQSARRYRFGFFMPRVNWNNKLIICSLVAWFVLVVIIRLIVQYFIINPQAN